MKKMYILVFTFIFLVCLVTACAECNNIGTPQDVYNGICEIFGEPYNKAAKRSTLADMFGDGIMEDLIFVLDRGKEAKEFWIALNSPDKPREMSLWIIDHATQNDYKKLFTILHQYAMGYGISETNRCIFLSYTDKEFYAFDTSADLGVQNEFDQIENMIEHLIKKYHSELLDWYKNELK